ncbi:hypothetical protein DLAC_00979 [Tieghemostelium lacteum]|uniref:Uncharacterized protein n=1 Tax=Tieghemostelium lacteum TaxID=361077 RepID=A0A152A7J2_TIELA|nr:hypothetical protein DLAC_00979 [Tieghemostelium lacteum]|eukprot:KYR02166.1 hypothetical protein DLAC_00979 [Tieghemostelium lacteum]
MIKIENGVKADEEKTLSDILLNQRKSKKQCLDKVDYLTLNNNQIVSIKETLSQTDKLIESIVKNKKNSSKVELIINHFTDISNKEQIIAFIKENQKKKSMYQLLKEIQVMIKESDREAVLEQVSNSLLLIQQLSRVLVNSECWLEFGLVMMLSHSVSSYTLGEDLVDLVIKKSQYEMVPVLLEYLTEISPEYIIKLLDFTLQSTHYKESPSLPMLLNLQVNQSFIGSSMKTLLTDDNSVKLLEFLWSQLELFVDINNTKNILDPNQIVDWISVLLNSKYKHLKDQTDILNQCEKHLATLRSIYQNCFILESLIDYLKTKQKQSEGDTNYSISIYTF